MSYKDADLITDKRKNPVPQYFNPVTNKYEPIFGRNGANLFIQLGKTIKQVWSGSTSVTKTFTSKMYGFAIVNDGTGDLIITINSITFTVKPGETFEDLFEGFSSVQISGNSAYRAVVRE
jgi:hypothetical protein